MRGACASFLRSSRPGDDLPSAVGLAGHQRCSDLRVGEQSVEIADCWNKTILERGARCPIEQFSSQRYVWLPLLRIVLGERAMLDARTGIGQLEDHLGQIDHCEFSWIAEVDRAGHRLRRR